MDEDALKAAVFAMSWPNKRKDTIRNIEGGIAAWNMIIVYDVAIVRVKTSFKWSIDGRAKLSTCERSAQSLVAGERSEKKNI